MPETPWHCPDVAPARELSYASRPSARRSSFRQTRIGVGRMSSRFSGGSSRVSTLRSRSASGSGSSTGWTATERCARIQAFSASSEARGIDLGPTGMRTSWSTRTLARVCLNVEPPRLPPIWPPIRLRSVLLPVLPEGPLGRPRYCVDPADGDVQSDATRKHLCPLRINPPRVQAWPIQPAETRGPIPRPHDHRGAVKSVEGDLHLLRSR